MDSSIFLQIFLLMNVFAVGLIIPFGIKHAKAHFKPEEHDAEKTHPRVSPAAHLPVATKERLLHQAEVNFQTIINRSTKDLERDLGNISVRLNKRVEKLSSDIIDNEIERYRTNLEKMRKEAEIKINNAQNDIDQHQADLRTKIDARQIELEKELTERIKARELQLIKDIDTKLADGVAAFLTETMQHNVDIGAQGDYLISMLEEHKAELKQGVSR